MSTLYVSTSGSVPNSGGVWRVSAAEYQYQYSSFTAGSDVNLDRVAVSTNTYDAGQSAPNNFQVGIYSAGVNALTPGSLLSYLSGPASPTPGEYNTYSATNSIELASGTQYWLGFTLSSDNGGSNSTRVKINSTSGDSSYLASGWSYGQRISVGAGSGSTGNTVRPLTFEIYGTPRAVCFCSGTFIRTPFGEKRINDLLIGDIICTSQGDLPVKWIAKRTIRRALTPASIYRQCLPIRIEAGSLGENLPSKDLLVSECHGLLVDGEIVNACFLENGLNIYKDLSMASDSEVQYFHVEFDEEVFVFANGVAACSYVNTGNRQSFDNYAEFIRIYIDANITVKTCITKALRSKPSIAGQKKRIRRSWEGSVVR